MRNPLKKLQKKINLRLANNAAVQQHKSSSVPPEKVSPLLLHGQTERQASTSSNLSQDDDPLFNNRSSKLRRAALAESQKANHSHNNHNHAASPTRDTPTKKKKKTGGRLSFGGAISSSRRTQKAETNITKKSVSVSPVKTPLRTPPSNTNTNNNNKGSPLTHPDPEHTTLSPSSHAHTPSPPKRQHHFECPTKSSELKMRDKAEISPCKRPAQAATATEEPETTSLSFDSAASSDNNKNSIVELEAKTPPQPSPVAADKKTTGNSNNKFSFLPSRTIVKTKTLQQSQPQTTNPPPPATKKFVIDPNLERIAKAAAALDNAGNELFERGEYDKAMAHYVKALKLKNRTLMTSQQQHSELELNDFLSQEKGTFALPPLPEGAATTTATAAAVDVKPQEPPPLKDESTTTTAPAADDLWISVATSINNIGYLRQQSGQASAEETMQAYQNSLQIKRRVLGNDNLSVGKTLNNLGTVHYLKREYDQALQAYREALQIMMATLGPFHLDVGTVHSNIGDVYWAQSGETIHADSGDSSSPQRNYQASRNSALRHYRQSLEIRWEELKDHHDPKVIRLLEKIAALEMGESFLALVQNNHRHRLSPRTTGDDVNADNGGADSPKGAQEWLDPDDAIEAASGQPHVQQELQSLHKEVLQDVQKLDLMQRKMAIDMVKDKLRLIREMKKLSSLNVYESDDDDEASIADDGSIFSTPRKATRPLSPEQRSEALSAVKLRLQQLRESRQNDSTYSFHTVSDLKEADRSPSNYFLSHKASQILSRTLHQHSSSSSSTKNALDQIRKFSFDMVDGSTDAPRATFAVNNRTTFALEEGIDALRSLSMNQENLQNQANHPWHVVTSSSAMTTSPEKTVCAPETPLPAASMAAF